MSGVAFMAALWMRSNYGGSCNSLRLRLFHCLKIRGSLARNPRFDACMCVVLSLWLCSGCAVTMGEAAKPYVCDLNMCQTVKIAGSVARNAPFDACMCVVLRLNVSKCWL